jgi:predicted dehydrogenase
MANEIPLSPESAQSKKTAGRKSSKTLKLGIIGCGFIADAHMNHFSKFDDVQFVAGCDIRKERRDYFEEKFGVPMYEKWSDMLKKHKFDLVDVCTPNHVHCKPTVDALNAGCHVFVEKPLAMNAREGQKMVDTAKQKRKKLTIGFQHRFEPSTQMIKRAVDSGSLGDILVAKVHAMRRRGIPNWGVFGQKELQGGGPMIDIGVHVIEMCHYAMGCPKPVAASGNFWTYMGNKPSDVVSMWPGWDHKTYTVEDLAIGQVRFENGAIMQIEAMFAGHIPPEMEGMKFELIGTRGAGTKDPAGLYYDRDGTMINATPHFLPKNDMWQVKMRNVVDVCLGNEQNLSPGEHGLMVQKMIDAVYASAEKGKEVTIK